MAIEAMARGIPVLATRAGALPEVIGDAGMLVEPENPAALREGMIRLMTDSALREDLGRRGRERYQQRYVLQRMGSECLEVFMRRSETGK